MFTVLNNRKYRAREGPLSSISPTCSFYLSLNYSNVHFGIVSVRMFQRSSTTFDGFGSLADGSMSLGQPASFVMANVSRSIFGSFCGLRMKCFGFFFRTKINCFLVVVCSVVCI